MPKIKIFQKLASQLLHTCCVTEIHFGPNRHKVLVIDVLWSEVQALFSFIFRIMFVFIMMVGANAVSKPILHYYSKQTKNGK